MHYFIDGYNLMFRILRAGDDLQSQREKIIHDLHEKIQLLDLDVTLVFDAQYQYGDETRSHLHPLEICFTREGETADDYIIGALKAAPNHRQETVITSDNKLAWRARRHLAKTESIEEFMSWLNKRYRNKVAQMKQKRPASKPSTQRIIPSRTPSKSSAPPKPGPTLNESFEYYLYEFEKKLRKSSEKKNEED